MQNLILRKNEFFGPLVMNTITYVAAALLLFEQDGINLSEFTIDYNVLEIV